MDAIGKPPEWALDWPWDAVVNATESDHWRPGKVRWEERPVERVITYGLITRPEIRSPESGTVVVPIDEPLPDPARRDALTDYRSAVFSFAKRFLLNADWSARAVHDALRLQQPIRLPARPEPFIAPPLCEPFTLDPKQPLPRSWLIRLAEALQAAAHSTDTAESAPGSPGSATSKAMPGETIWAGAVDHVRIGLRGDTIPQLARKHAQRARPWLNAAVSGRLGAPPLHRADDPADLAKRPRTKEQRAERANAERVAQDGHRRTDSRHSRDGGDTGGSVS